jgi:hypothetical protein
MRSAWYVAALVAFLSPSAEAGVALQGAGVSGTGGGLFSQIGSQSTVAGQPVWPASLDIADLATFPPSIVVNFPDRASATLARMRAVDRGSGAFVWTGRGDGCTAVINVNTTNVFGVISCVTGNYSLRGPPATLQLSRFVRTNAAPFDLPAVGPSPLQYQQPQAPRLSGQVDTTVDVLVLYSEAVRQYLDGSGSASSAKTRQFAQTAIDMVQAAMEASTTPGQPTIANVRLVGVSEVSRTATGDLFADQRWMNTDPEPNGLRDFWAADVTMYLTTDAQPGLFGTSNIPGDEGLPLPGPAFASSAHAAVVVRCALFAMASDCPDPYVLAHELAHLFGANHNPESPHSSTPVEPWAFAHWARNFADGGGAHTLVAYYISNCAPALSQCPIVLNYSNAEVNADVWFKTGIKDKRENARVIEEFAPTTAQYRLDVGRIFYDGFQF